MSERDFDELAKALSSQASRRTLLKLLLGGLLGGLTGLFRVARPAQADDDDDNCLAVGSACKKGNECCSERCRNNACICMEDEDCPRPASPCQRRVCRSGVCGVNNRSNGSICDDGDHCTENDRCQNDGTCRGTPIPGCCNAASDCPDDGNPCTRTVCEQHQCRPVAVADGTACPDDGDICTRDVCRQGVCFHDLIPNCCDNDADCMASDETCCAGVCVNLASDESNCGVCGVVCPYSDEPCIENSACIDGVCTHISTEAGAPCDDGNACTSGDACNGEGLCVGTPVVCDDGNECTTDTCDPQTGSCVSEPVPDGTACDDGNACTQTGTCQNGVCTGGNPVNCDDGNPCTNDTCDAVTGCGHTLVANGTPCGNGQVCINGACSETCTPGSTRPCYSGPPGSQNVGICRPGVQLCNSSGQYGPCIGEVVPRTEICGNGLDDDCNGVVDNGCCASDADCQASDETCCAGVCVNLASDESNCGECGTVCPTPNEPCLESACIDGVCTEIPTEAGAPCDDGDMCTLDEHCDGAGLCVPGFSVTCSQPDPCIISVCNPDTGFCHPTAFADPGTPCNDGNPCTTDDRCDGGGLCFGDQPVICEEDDNPCTDTTCSSVEGGCVSFVVPGRPCDDGDPCTVEDVCQTDGTCAGTPIPGCTP